MSTVDENYASGFGVAPGWRQPQPRKTDAYLDKKMLIGLAMFIGLSVGLIVAVKVLVGAWSSGSTPAQSFPANTTNASAYRPPAAAEQNLNANWEGLDPAYRNYKVTIESDSGIKLNGKPARLYAFNVLPRSRICAYGNGERWACGQRAYIALLNIMGSTTIDCRPTKAAALTNLDFTEIFTCRLPGTDISEILLREGWGTLDSGVADERYIDAAAVAYRSKTGMWALTPKAPSR